MGDTMSIYNGNVGVGTINPTQKLEVQGGGLRLNNLTALPTCDANARGTLWFFHPIGDLLAVCGLRNDGTTYQWVSIACWWTDCMLFLSDARLKKNIEPFAPVLDKLAQLQPVSFEYRADEFPELQLDSGPKKGLIAQEVEKVLPELVTQGGQFKGVKYDQLPMLLLQAIRELKATKDNMEEQLQQLRSEMEALKARLGVEVSRAPR